MLGSPLRRSKLQAAEAYRLLAVLHPVLPNADLECVTSRLKTTLAPVRSLHHLTTVELLLIPVQDVTTRGEYYPDKSMATAAVCCI